MYHTLAYIHFATIVPCFLMGTYLLLRKKGTAQHKFLGRIYFVLMLFTATLTLFMPAEVGPRLFDHFGYLHLLSLLTIYTIPSSYFAVKQRNIKKHQRGMVILYTGGMLVAGAFTLMPGRLLHTWIFG